MKTARNGIRRFGAFHHDNEKRLPQHLVLRKML